MRRRVRCGESTRHSAAARYAATTRRASTGRSKLEEAHRPERDRRSARATPMYARAIHLWISDLPLHLATAFSDPVIPVQPNVATVSAVTNSMRTPSRMILGRAALAQSLYPSRTGSARRAIRHSQGFAPPSTTRAKRDPTVADRLTAPHTGRYRYHRLFQTRVAGHANRHVVRRPRLRAIDVGGHFTTRVPPSIE